MQGLISLQRRLDRVRFAQAAGIEPDPWQADLLHSQKQRVLLCCSRQSGKSTIAAVLAMHTAMYEPHSPILLLSPSLRQSQELFRKCLDVYRALDRPIAPEAESALRLELSNGSRIISLPGKEQTVRGISGVRLLLIDEAARVPDELYMSVRPMLAVSGGRLVLLSTPWGTRGFFHQTYLHRAEWDYYEVPATQCKRISADFLAEEKRVMGQYWFESEYMCRFLDSQGAAFRSEDIDAIIHEEVQPWNLSYTLDVM